jgi:hypothetical protein
MFRNLVKKVGAALVAAATTEPPPRGPTANPAAVERQRKQFDRRTEDLIASRPDPSAPVVAGAVQLLGMWDIQAELGEVWHEVAANAYGATERVLRKHLKGADVYTRKDEENYILCFATLDRVQAERKTKAIVEEIKEVLLREVPEAGQLRVGHRITEVDPGRALNGGSLLETIAASIESVKQEAEDVFERQKRLLLEEASVVFAPVWSPSGQSVVLYRCVLDDWTSRTTLQNLSMFSEPEDLQRAISDLDYLLLGRAIQTLHRVLQSNGKTVLLVPVHFQTLAQRARRDEYLQLCQKMPRPYGKFLFFEVYGVPSQTPASRILQIIRPLQPHGNALIVSIGATEERVLFELGTSGIYGVTLSLDELSGGASLLPKYATAASAVGLRTFAHGARTIGLARAAVDAGFDYLDGEAIATKVEAPKGAYRWNPLETLDRTPPLHVVR